MPLVEPTKPRGRFTDTPRGLEFVVPAKRMICRTTVLGFWLCGWAFGEVTVINQLISRGHNGGGWFLLVWLALWTIGGVSALYAFLWSLFGKERVLLSHDRLSIRREVLGLSRAREYRLADIENLRVSPQSYSPFDFSSSLQFWGIGGGPIAFDYGASTVRFAASIAESEADSVVNRFSQRADLGDSVA